MKRAFCPDGWDVFKLSLEGWRQCLCGKVVGRYKDQINAEVSENAISLALEPEEQKPKQNICMAMVGEKSCNKPRTSRWWCKQHTPFGYESR